MLSATLVDQERSAPPDRQCDAASQTAKDVHQVVAARLLSLAAMVIAASLVPREASANGITCQARVQSARELLAFMHDRMDVAGGNAGPTLVKLADAASTRCARMLLPLLVRSLGDHSDFVRYYAAAAIAALGPPARRAVPALEAATKLDKCVCWDGSCVKQTASSTIAIQYAVMELTGSEGDPEIYTCEHSGGAKLAQHRPPSASSRAGAP